MHVGVAAEVPEHLRTLDLPDVPDAVPAEATEIAQIEIWSQQPRHAQSGPRRAPAQRSVRNEGDEQRPPRREHRPRPAGGEGAGGEGRAARFDKFRTPGKPPRDERRGPRPSVAVPERRERQPDPDSPFAKLAALKAEMEKKGKS